MGPVVSFSIFDHVATPTLLRPCWVMGFPQIRRVFLEEDRGRWKADSATKLHQKAFDSCKLSAYIWLLSPDLHWGSTPGHGCPPCSGRVGSWDSLRSEDLFGGIGGDGGRSRQQNSVKKHLTAANCLYISGFYPQTSTGALPLGPHWGTSAPKTTCAHPDFRAWLHHWKQSITSYF